jgi:ferric-chelate reductase [NAD(P)H]
MGPVAVIDANALRKISYGIYVVASRRGDKFNGQIANTVFQVTSDPVKVAVCINKQNLTHEFIRESGVFSVSILSKETPISFIAGFGFRSGRDYDKFKGVNFKVGVTGAPIVIDNAIGYLEAKVFSSYDVGTHTLFVGEVVNAEVFKDEEPLTYAYYQEMKKGRTPPTAPSYVKSR